MGPRRGYFKVPYQVCKAYVSFRLDSSSPDTVGSTRFLSVSCQIPNWAPLLGDQGIYFGVEASIINYRSGSILLL